MGMLTKPIFIVAPFSVQVSRSTTWLRRQTSRLKFRDEIVSCYKDPAELLLVHGVQMKRIFDRGQRRQCLYSLNFFAGVRPALGVVTASAEGVGRGGWKFVPRGSHNFLSEGISISEAGCQKDVTALSLELSQLIS
jgi:hypothetical protein